MDEICDFGRHKGEPYTRVPVSYLLWMVNINHPSSNIAKTELDRRGTVLPNIDISGHAIDRASQRCLGKWQRNKLPNEGLHAWLVRISNEAIENGQEYREGCYRYFGMKFIFEQDGIWPVLKTITRLTKEI